jgi:hypothetical protein
VTLSDTGRQLRRHLFTMIGTVVVVDAAIIAAFYYFEIEQRPDRIRMLFTAAWVLVTLLIVLRGMARIRDVRLRARRARPRPV